MEAEAKVVQQLSLGHNLWFSQIPNLHLTRPFKVAAQLLMILKDRRPNKKFVMREQGPSKIVEIESIIIEINYL